MRGGWTHPKGGLKGGAPKETRSEMMARLKNNAKKATEEKKAKSEEKARRSQKLEASSQKTEAAYPPSLPQPTPMETVDEWTDAASEASDATMDPERFILSDAQLKKAQEVAQAGRSAQLPCPPTPMEASPTNPLPTAQTKEASRRSIDFGWRDDDVLSPQCTPKKPRLMAKPAITPKQVFTDKGNLADQLSAVLNVFGRPLNLTSPKPRDDGQLLLGPVQQFPVSPLNLTSPSRSPGPQHTSSTPGPGLHQEAPELNPLDCASFLDGSLSNVIWVCKAGETQFDPDALIIYVMPDPNLSNITATTLCVCIMEDTYMGLIKEYCLRYWLKTTNTKLEEPILTYINTEVATNKTAKEYEQGATFMIHERKKERFTLNTGKLWTCLECQKFRKHHSHHQYLDKYFAGDRMLLPMTSWGSQKMSKRKSSWGAPKPGPIAAPKPR